MYDSRTVTPPCVATNSTGVGAAIDNSPDEAVNCHRSSHTVSAPATSRRPRSSEPGRSNSTGCPLSAGAWLAYWDNETETIRAPRLEIPYVASGVWTRMVSSAVPAASGSAGAAAIGAGPPATSAGVGAGPVAAAVESTAAGCGRGFLRRSAGAMTMAVMSRMAQMKRRSMVRSRDQGIGS